MKRYIVALVSLFTFLGIASSVSAQTATPAGEYQGVHRHWTDKIIINADGTYKRAVNNDPGKWTYDGKTLILKWAKWPAETLVQTAPGVFSCTAYKFTLTSLAPKAVLAAGEYQGVHRHWTDKVIINADGTYKRAVNNDPGTWTYDGKKLILKWAKWPAETLIQTAPGVFSCAEYPFTLTAPGIIKPVIATLAAGEYQGVHRHWTDKIIIKADGTYKRAVNNDPGTWTYDGKKLVLKWAKWPAETLIQTAPGVFSCAEYPFTLTAPGIIKPVIATLAAGEYQGVHRYWTDKIIIKADGTYKRAVNNDPGTWTYDGKKLVLKWAKWPAETLIQTAPGVFSCAEYPFTLTAPGIIKPNIVTSIAGEYKGDHKDWKNNIIINADGTYRGTSTREVWGTWTFDGKTLVLKWTKWPAETLVQTTPGVFSCPAYKFTLTMMKPSR